MSNRYKGAIISATPPTTTGGSTGVASGAWTLEQQMQLQAAGLWPSQPPPPSIEDVFSTYLWTGNDSSQTITNGINLSGKGGLVWIKSRAAYSHILSDTNRGTGKFLSSNTTDAQGTDAQDVTAFNTTGFTVGNNSRVNNSSFTYASWTFREQAKFFDVVTVTGNGASTQTINHSLGSVPAVIIYKPVNTTGGWIVYHRSIPTKFTRLNTTAVPSNAGSNLWNPTSTTFDATSYYGNDIGVTYVAYIFAHNAGGFGLTETENVISCGSYTGNGQRGNGPVITLGYEPQWVLIKNITQEYDWVIVDNMRNMSLTSGNTLAANSSAAEFVQSSLGIIGATATGFTPLYEGANVNQNGSEFIYIAIRRGPMAVPTTGTSVFSPVAYTGNGATRLYSVGFPTDLSINSARSLSLRSPWWSDRLRGGVVQIFSDGAGAEGGGGDFAFDYQTSIYVTSARIASGETYINWCFRRAPSFFDEVCYTGTGANATVTHNLAAVPELMIVKGRSGATAWQVYSSALANTEYLVLNTTDAKATGATRWNSTTPTSSVFSVGASSTTTNDNGGTYVAYLFATCAGVSKVGSYTGTGTTQTINCGFTAGSRFVLIKRTDSTGAWYVWDSARGIVAGNDPYLLLNTSDAEVTNTDYVDTAATGFEISSTAPAAINANGGTFIFLAIA